MISKHIVRIEKHLEKLEMMHDLLGREIAETREELAALALAESGQRELPLDDPPAPGHLTPSEMAAGFDGK